MEVEGNVPFAGIRRLKKANQRQDSVPSAKKMDFINDI